MKTPKNSNLLDSGKFLCNFRGLCCILGYPLEPELQTVLRSNLGEIGRAYWRAQSLVFKRTAHKNKTLYHYSCSAHWSFVESASHPPLTALSVLARPKESRSSSEESLAADVVYTYIEAPCSGLKRHFYDVIPDDPRDLELFPRNVQPSSIASQLSSSTAEIFVTTTY